MAFNMYQIKRGRVDVTDKTRNYNASELSQYNFMTENRSFVHAVVARVVAACA